MGQELRPYQQQARDRIHAEWDAGHTRTLLVLPTGTGKTIVFASVAADQVRAGDRVLILAHRGELLEQAADKLQRSTGLVSAVERPNPPAWTAGFGWWWAACRPCSAPPGWNAFPGITSAPSSSTRPTTPSPTVTAASWTTSAGPRCLASPPRRTAATCAIWARCSTAWPLSTN